MFEDVIDFREDGYDILGFGIEEILVVLYSYEES